MGRRKTSKVQFCGAIGTTFLLLCYVGGYLHLVRPMPIKVEPNRESVEPVFNTVSYSIIRLFRPAIAVDQALFPGRWELARFQLQPTDLAGLHKMKPFRARVESVDRITLQNAKVSGLRLGLRFESGYYLQIHEPAATEQMFAVAGSLMDHALHEFPRSWVEAK